MLCLCVYFNSVLEKIFPRCRPIRRNCHCWADWTCSKIHRTCQRHSWNDWKKSHESCVLWPVSSYTVYIYVHYTITAKRSFYIHERCALLWDFTYSCVLPKSTIFFLFCNQDVKWKIYGDQCYAAEADIANWNGSHNQLFSPSRLRCEITFKITAFSVYACLYS